MLTRGEGWGGDGTVKFFEIDMYTRLYLKWITSKDLLHSTGNSDQCYMTGCMGGEFRGEWICVYICMSESLCYASKTITTLLIGYLLILNKKLFF